MANKKQFKPTVVVKEKKADIFLGTKENTAKGSYKSAKGKKAADDIRKAMKK